MYLLSFRLSYPLWPKHVMTISIICRVVYIGLLSICMIKYKSIYMYFVYNVNKYCHTYINKQWTHFTDQITYIVNMRLYMSPFPLLSGREGLPQFVNRVVFPLDFWKLVVYIVNHKQLYSHVKTWISRNGIKNVKKLQ